MDTEKSLNQGMISLIATLDNLGRALKKEASHTNATVYKDEVELYFLLHSMRVSLSKGACSKAESELAISFIERFLSMYISQNEVLTNNAN